MSTWPGSGFIQIILYGTGGSIIGDDKALLTENNFNILTETSQDIDTE